MILWVPVLDAPRVYAYIVKKFATDAVVLSVTSILKAGKDGYLGKNKKLYSVKNV